MSADTPRLPATFNRLAWSNLAAQSAEQIALAAAPIVAVLVLGVGALGAVSTSGSGSGCSSSAREGAANGSSTRGNQLTTCMAVR